MNDDGKCYAATPAATLEEHIVNSNVAKSDTEWWAHHEITRLRAENKRMREALKIFVSKEPIQLTYNGRAFVQTVIVFESDLVMARAALEGVTEPEIQS